MASKETKKTSKEGKLPHLGKGEKNLTVATVAVLIIGIGCALFAISFMTGLQNQIFLIM